MMIDRGLPQLAVGSHERGSGLACVMNYVSYINGDCPITDRPACTHPLLALVAAGVNDRICSHGSRDPATKGLVVEMLCRRCSARMLRYAARLIGTAGPGQDDPEAMARLSIALALAASVATSEWFGQRHFDAAYQIRQLVEAMSRHWSVAELTAARAMDDVRSAWLMTAPVPVLDAMLDSFDAFTGRRSARLAPADHARAAEGIRLSAVELA